MIAITKWSSLLVEPATQLTQIRRRSPIDTIFLMSEIALKTVNHYMAFLLPGALFEAEGICRGMVPFCNISAQKGNALDLISITGKWHNI